jgi:hypothetical protein
MSPACRCVRAATMRLWGARTRVRPEAAQMQVLSLAVGGQRDGPSDAGGTHTGHRCTDDAQYIRLSVSRARGTRARRPQEQALRG